MRVSSLPALFECPSSQLETENPYNPGSDAASLGSAVHEALGDHVADADTKEEDIALKYGVPVDELSKLTAYGRIAWQSVKQEFTNPMVEHRLAGKKLSGCADVFSLDDQSMAVLDWKTNRERSDYRAQLLGYADCAVQQYGWPPSGEVKVVTVWVRLFEADVLTVRAAELEKFNEDLQWALREIGMRYAPGSACTYCRRQLVCPARHDFIRSSATALQALDGGALMTPDVLASLYPRAQLLGRALERYREAFRMVLADGPVQGTNGETYELGEMRRETIKPREAWPLLVAHGFTEDDLAGCVSISGGAIDTVVASRAPRGQKGIAKKQLREALREAGAVSERTYPTIKTIKGDNT